MQREKGGLADEFQGKALVFFDGQCGLCDSFVRFILQKDRRGRLLCAPLQGATARRFLQKEDRENLKSIIFLKDGKILRESQAIAEILAILYPRAAGLLKILPKTLPWGFYNIFYRLIAKNRYSIWGGKGRSRRPARDGQPAEEEKKAILP